jgi:hypothetical protein
MRAGDRSVLLLFKKGATPDRNAVGAIHIAFGIARSDLATWKHWLAEQGIPVELPKTWKYWGEALYFRDPDGHLPEVVTPGVLSYLLTPPRNERHGKKISRPYIGRLVAKRMGSAFMEPLRNPEAAAREIATSASFHPGSCRPPGLPGTATRRQTTGTEPRSAGDR